MKFLAPVGGLTNKSFGILTSPSMRGIPAGIIAGLEWAADNNAFTKKFDPNKFFPWLETFSDYRSTCLFVNCPDVVGDAEATLKQFYEYRPLFVNWPVAFVGQDGQESLSFPPSNLWDALFIGGTTEWKLSEGAVSCIKYAQSLGKHIHIGRVNYYKRYKHFRELAGSERFTCDGTRMQYEGTEHTIKQWQKYMDCSVQLSFDVPDSNCRG